MVTAGTGCKDSVTQSFVVYPQPSASFNIDSTTCAFSSLTPTNNTLAKANPSFLWAASSSSVSISDSLASSPSFSFADNQSGTDSVYTISLIVTSADGCLDTTTEQVTVYSRPIASFNLPSSSCGPLTLSPVSTAVGAGSSLSYLWTIDPVVPTSGAATNNPQFSIPATFSDSLVYRITLTVTDNRGCVDSVTQFYTAYPRPTAAFVPSVTDSCGPLTVRFSNASNSGQSGMDTSSMSFSWDFGNGASATSTNPAATFTNTGVVDSVYLVQMIATNAFGCSDTVSDTIRVHPNPVAQISFNFNADCAPFVLDSSVVSAISSSANDAYSWQVLDKDLNILTSFSGQNALNYTLINPNDSVVLRLIANNNFGCKPDTTQQLFFTLPNPIAGFIISQPAGCTPHTTNIIDTSSSGVTHAWFINGSYYSSLPAPVFSFTNTSYQYDSVYTIKLVVTAGTGCKDSISQNITVYPLPYPNFNANNVCDYDSVYFQDLSTTSDSIVNWIWDFGDGSTDSIANPIHFYSTSGYKTVTLTVIDSRGCSNTVLDTLLIYPSPTANFDQQVGCGIDTVCVFQPVALQDQSIIDTLGAPIVNWYWDIEADGSIDYTSQNPTHTFQDTGLTVVALKVQTIYGCLDSVFQTLYVSLPPVASFKFDTISNCGPVTINPIDSSYGVISGYTWRLYVIDSLGNETSIYQTNNPAPSGFPALLPSYREDTTYYYELIVWNCCGSDTLTKSITLKPLPVAAMLASTLVGCTPLPVTFQLDGLVNGNPDYLVLNYGDGTPIDTLYEYFIINSFGDTTWFWGQQNHVFVNPILSDTTYTVSLTAYNECGDSTVTLSILVHPNAVQAFFQSSPTTGCAPLTVSFQNYSFGGTNYSWCFDYDPVSKICNQPVGTGQITSHVYPQPGTYNVAIFVDDGCSYDTAIQVITVYPSPLAQFTNTNFLCAGDTINFTDQSTINNGFISSVKWYFGDGDSSSLTNPSHIYASGGNFTVNLVVTSSNGCKDSIQKIVVIYDKPDVKFGADNLCFNQQPVQFIDSSTVQSGTINSTLWKFGDGNTSVASNPTHTYLSPGLYIVTLIHSSTNGCVDSTSKIINIYPEPTANFNYTRVGTDSCSVPQSFQFTQQATSSLGYYWDFDYLNNRGLNTSTLNNPTFTFTNYGIYHVALFTYNQYGCKDSIIKPISIRPVPSAGFYADTLSGCQPLNVSFFDTSGYQFSGPGGIVSWQWDFGDGTFSTLQNPSHTYTTFGSFIVRLVVTTDGGCSDTIVYNNYINVYPTPEVDFEMQFENAKKIFFKNKSINIDTNSTYYWTFGDGESSTERSPVHTYNVDLTQGPASFQVCLTVVNGFGCTGSDCEQLDLKSLQLNVPSAFAPEVNNGFDGNIFLPKGHSLRDYKLTIYDKWGNIVFQTTELDAEGKPAVGWDGNHYVNGTPLPMGAYTWRIDAWFNDGTCWLGKEVSNGERRIVGTVTLIR